MITGGIVSTTLIILVAVVVLPAASVAVYVIDCSPTSNCEDVLDVVTLTEPSLTSVAVAPAST